MEGENVPVNLVMMRAGCVPNVVYDNGANAQAGITGSDILWEAGKKKEGIDLPTIKTGSKLFVGANREFKERIETQKGRDFELEDFEGSMIITKFPNITEEVFEGVDVEVKYSPGSTEGAQFFYPNCNGILDVIASGATAKANDIEVVSFVLDPVTTRIIEKSDLTSQQERILAEFKGSLL